MLKNLVSVFKKSIHQPGEDTPLAESQPVTEKTSWLGQIIDHFASSTTAETITEADYETLEDMLIKADLGVDLAMSLVESIRKAKVNSKDQLSTLLKAELLSILAPIQHRSQLKYDPKTLNIYMFVGVNGVGKTTIIARLAYHFRKYKNKKVLIAAADTFRAAAVEQLLIWGERINVPVVALDTENPAAVVYEAIQKAKVDGADVLIIDTAGRLQNKYNLMEELKNLRNTIQQQAPAEHVYEALLVVDATTGQNAIQQAEVFSEVCDLTGVCITKIDGTAKGGIVFALADKFKLPIKYLGVGETKEDLEEFDAHTFVEKLFE